VHGAGHAAKDEWVHLKIEFAGTQARVFLGDSTRPALVIDDLKRGATRGTVGVMGPRDGSAFFSDFRYRADDRLSFEPSPPAETPPGTIGQWQISPVYGLERAIWTVRPTSRVWGRFPGSP